MTSVSHALCGTLPFFFYREVTEKRWYVYDYLQFFSFFSISRFVSHGQKSYCVYIVFIHLPSFCWIPAVNQALWYKHWEYLRGNRTLTLLPLNIRPLFKLLVCYIKQFKWTHILPSSCYISFNLTSLPLGVNLFIHLHVGSLPICNTALNFCVCQDFLIF